MECNEMGLHKMWEIVPSDVPTYSIDIVENFILTQSHFR